MLSGIIDKDRYGNYIIRVDGYPRMRFIGYNKREAVSKYRLDHLLYRKRISFLDMSERSCFLSGKGGYVKC